MPGPEQERVDATPPTCLQNQRNPSPNPSSPSSEKLVGRLRFLWKANVSRIVKSNLKNKSKVRGHTLLSDLITSRKGTVTRSAWRWCEDRHPRNNGMTGWAETGPHANRPVRFRWHYCTSMGSCQPSTCTGPAEHP